MIEMKILSVRQPWAWWIFNGKDIENRPKSNRYIGPLLIHASATWIDKDVDTNMEAARLMALKAGIRGVGPLKSELRMNKGHILGLVHCAGWCAKSESPWFVGPIGHMLEQPRLLAKPIPFKAMLGFIDAPEAIVADIKRQLTL